MFYEVDQIMTFNFQFTVFETLIEVGKYFVSETLCLVSVAKWAVGVGNNSINFRRGCSCFSVQWKCKFIRS